jgi:topoisomerase-4 subunit B
MVSNYDEGSIITLDWQEHIRKRPGMYIGKLGDGTAGDDGEREKDRNTCQR